MVFLLALSPILWLIVSLGFLKMQSFKACPIALIVSLPSPGLVSYAGHGCRYGSPGRRGPGMLAYFTGHHRRYLYV